jgi:hypothetical protein
MYWQNFILSYNIKTAFKTKGALYNEGSEEEYSQQIKYRCCGHKLNSISRVRRNTLGSHFLILPFDVWADKPQASRAPWKSY